MSSFNFINRILLVATGMWKPNVPPMKGLDLAEGYEHINLDPSHYEGKTVLILGEFFGSGILKM